MGQEFSTTETLIRTSALGDAFLAAPLEFLKRHPETLLVHRSRDDQLSPQELRDLQERTVSAPDFSVRKRFALKLETASHGPICLKFRSLSWTEGLLGPLHARAELRRHTEVKRRHFAATEPLGIGTWRDNTQKRWQYFIQRWIDPSWASGESLLKESLSATKLATEIAALHNAGIFHGDLKPYHVAIPSDAAHWLYLDLDPVRFGLSQRRRAINLYQGLRYFLAAERSLASTLIEHYVKQLDSKHTTSLSKLTHQTLKLFDQKMETHSGPRFINDRG